MASPTTTHKTEADLAVWRVSSDSDLSWRCWDGEYVVFNPVTGNTHLLDVASGHVLMSLLAGPTELGRIRDQLAGFLEVEADDRLAAAVSEILSRLEDLDLIEAVEPCA